MSTVDEEEARTTVKATMALLSLLLDEVRGLRAAVEETRGAAWRAASRAEGACLQIERLRASLSLDPTASATPRDPLDDRVAQEASAELAALDAAVAARREVALAGTTAPVDAEEVREREQAVDEAQRALDEAVLSADSAPTESDLLAAGFQFQLLRVGVQTHEECSRPLTPSARAALEEVYAAAASISRSSDASVVFGIYMLWVEMYVRDAAVRRGDKTAEHMFTRLQWYVAAKWPEPGKAWTRVAVWREWRAALGFARAG